MGAYVLKPITAGLGGGDLVVEIITKAAASHILTVYGKGNTAAIASAVAKCQYIGTFLAVIPVQASGTGDGKTITSLITNDQSVADKCALTGTDLGTSNITAICIGLASEAGAP